MAKPVRRPGIAHGAVDAVVTAFAVVETQFSTGNLEVAVVTAGSYLYRAEVVTVEDDSAKTRRRLHMNVFYEFNIERNVREHSRKSNTCSDSEGSSRSGRRAGTNVLKQ